MIVIDDINGKPDNYKLATFHHTTVYLDTVYCNGRVKVRANQLNSGLFFRSSGHGWGHVELKIVVRYQVKCREVKSHPRM